MALDWRGDGPPLNPRADHPTWCDEYLKLYEPAVRDAQRCYLVIRRYYDLEFRTVVAVTARFEFEPKLAKPTA